MTARGVGVGCVLLALKSENTTSSESVCLYICTSYFESAQVYTTCKASSIYKLLVREMCSYVTVHTEYISIHVTANSAM